MYPVSADYINASKRRSKYEEIEGYIKLVDGTEISLDDTNIVQNSVSIDWQALNDASVFAFGGAVSTKLNLTVFSSLSRYAFLGAEVSLTYKLLVAENTFESVPLGVYYVQTSEKTANKVRIEAYDCLSKLDAFIGSTIFSGTALEIMTKVCSMSNTQLGLTEAQYELLPNHSAEIQLSEANDCKSLRDIAKAVAQLTGAYVTSTRDGKLTLKQFAPIPVVTLTEANRYKFIPADYFCVYNGLSVTSMKGTYYYKDPNIGIVIPGTHAMYPDLTMYINDAPAWDYGLDSTLNLRVQNIVERLAELIYTPGDINLPNNPMYECGDMVRLSVGSSNIDVLITNVQWKYKNPMTLSSVGTNPFFSEASGVGGSARTPSKDSGNELVMYTYINDSAIQVGPGEETWTSKLLRLAFLTRGATSVFFLASISFQTDFAEGPTKLISANIVDDNGITTTLTADNGNSVSHISLEVPNPRYGEIEFAYVLDNLPVNVVQRHSLDNVNELVTLFLPIPIVGENSVHTLDLYVSGRSDQILQAIVPITGLQASLLGQNLVKSDSVWDGILSFIDNIARYIIQANIVTIADSTPVITTYNPIRATLTDDVPAISTNGFTLQTFTENVTIKTEYLPNVIKMSNAIPVEMGMWGWI